MNSRLYKLGLFGAILLIFAFSFLKGAAQGSVSSIGNNDLEKICLPENIAKSEKSDSREDYKLLLKRCLRYEEEMSKQYDQKMEKTKQKGETLKGEIGYLKNKIARLENQIYQSSLMMKDLDFQISDTETSIKETSLKINDSKKKLANILRAIYEEQQRSLIEIFLSENQLSDFFDNLAELEVLNNTSQDLLNNIERLKVRLESQKVSLSNKKNDVENLLAIRALQKRDEQNAKKKKEYLLTMNNAERLKYLKQKRLTDKRVAAIKARMFALVGVEKAPSFGQAIKIAKYAADLVNIRPAFLLAIISQESAIGRNVGQCYVTNKKTGAGVYRNGKPVSRLMNSNRDLPIFLKITGNNFSKTPVSCWIPQCAAYRYGRLHYCGAKVDSRGNIHCDRRGYVPFGFGGAMGPAQFIPRTWVLIEDRLKKYTGENSPSPWDIKDSFIASAIYLRDLGASRNEIVAASRYYGGSYRYALEVSKRASCIQTFMDEGTMSSSCKNLIF